MRKHPYKSPEDSVGERCHPSIAIDSRGQHHGAMVKLSRRSGILIVAGQLGHADVSTTMIYTLGLQ